MKTTFIFGILLILISIACADGELSTTFNVEDLPSANALLATPDGGFLAAAQGRLYKLDNLGRVDESFVSQLEYTPGGSLHSIVPDGLGDYFVVDWVVFGGRKYDLAKITADGRINTSFAPLIAGGFSHGGASFISAITADNEGGCYIGGNFTEINGVSSTGIAHVKASGAVRQISRNTGLPNGTPIYLAIIDNRLLVVEETSLALKNSDDSWDVIDEFEKYNGLRLTGASYDSNFGLAVSFSFLSNGVSESRISVLMNDGTVDPNFENELVFSWPLTDIGWDSEGRLVGLNARINSLQSQYTDDFSNWGPKRILPNGALDPNWSRTLDFDSVQSTWCQLVDGSYIIAGGFSTVGSINSNRYARLRGITDSDKPAVQQSTRVTISEQNTYFIMGLVVPASDWTRDFLVRGMSVSLESYGIRNVAGKTHFTIYKDENEVFSSDSDDPKVVERFVGTQLGAFPSIVGGDEAQKLINLESGAYTIVFTTEDNYGEVLGEIYSK